MFVLKEAFHEFFGSVITYQETAKIVTATYKTVASKMPNVEQLKVKIALIPENDGISLRMFGISDSNCTVERATWENSYSQFLETQEENDEIEITLLITKNETVCNIYSFEEYWKVVSRKNLSETLKYFADLYLAGTSIFHVLDRKIHVKAYGIIFSNSESLKVEWNRDKCIQKYQEASVFLNRNEIPFVPEDFHVIEKKSGEPVFSLFQKLESVLYLLYIANTSYVAENKLVIQLKIDLGMDIELHDFQFNEKIQEIGSWIFSGDSAVERAGIARNILAEKCKTSSDLLNISQDTINSIKSNFVIYQRDTTEQYIETKNRIADNIVELSRQQEEMVQDIVDGLRNNLIAIVTFLITVILAGVDMDKMLQGDSLPYNVRFVTIILIIGSIVYLIASIIGTYFKLKSLERGYNHLKEYYKTLLVADDVNTTFDSTYDETVQRVKKYQNIIACIWGAFIIVMIVVYVWFAHPEVVKWISEFFCKSRQVQKK